MIKIGQSYTTETLKQALAQSTLDKEQIKTILSANGLQGELLETTADEIANAASTNAVAASQAGATATTLSLGTAIKGLGIFIKNTTKEIYVFLTTNPIGWAIAAISAIAIIIARIVILKKTIEEGRKKIIEAGKTARDEIKSLKSELNDLSSSADKATKSYAKLIDGVDALNHTNISLSDEEYEEFISASNELADLFPELVVGLDKEGNKILDLGSSAEESTAKINNLIEAQKRLVAEETEEKLVDVYNGIYEETRDANNYLESSQKNLDYFNNMDSRDFDIYMSSWHNSLKEGKTIALADSYMDGVDSEILMNNIAKVINDSFGSKLSPKYSTMTHEWFIDLSTLVDRDEYETEAEYEKALEETYEEAIQSLHLNSDLLKGKITESLETSISDARNDINRYHKNELSSIFTALSDDVDYISLNDTERQLANSIISGLDYSEYRDVINSKYGGDITAFLNQDILDALYHATDEDKEKINQAYSDLLSIDPEASLSDNIQLIEKYIGDLSEALHIDENKLKIILGYEYVDDDKERIRQAKIKATGSDKTDARSVANGSAQVQRAIDNLSNHDLTLFLEADISDETKFKTLEEFESFMDSLRKKSKVDVEVETPDITSPLSDIKDAYSSFEDIFDEIESGATVSASSIDGLTEKFGNLNGGESLEKFKEVLTTMPDDTDACKEALNQLATEYLDQSDLLQNLTVDNADYTESELRKLGVINAHEVVQSRLIQHDYSEADAKAVLINYSNQLTDEKKKEYITSLDLSSATDKEIASLLKEANAAGIDTTALQSYVRQKIQANAATLTTDGDISNLIALCSALGGSVSYMQKYADAKEKLSKGQSLTGYWKGDDDYLHQLELGAKRELERALNNSKNANVNYGGVPSSSSSSGSGSSSETDTSKEYDWISVAIQRCEEAIERLEKVESNTYTDWSKRNNALNEEINQTAKEIGLLQRSYEGYMAKANSVGLSDAYKQKVQNGTIEIETITDKGLQEQIDAYQQWYEEAVSVKDKIDELNISLSELAEQKFDNIVTQFEDLEEVFTSLNDRIEASIDLAEAKGRLISKNYYTEMLKNENENNRLLVQQRDQMVQSLNEAVGANRIKEGSEAWYDLHSQISEVNKAIIESNTSIQKFNNSIRELDWEVFDLLQDNITNIADEIEFMTSLLNNESLTDGLIDRGLTGEGIAQLGNYASKYNIYMAQAEKYAEEIRKIESDIAKDPANQDLINRKQELVDAQQDVILSANEEKQAMFDLARDGYNAVLESLQELINKKKEDLNSTREVYEYQRKITEKTKNIASIRKRLSVFENDNSEEAKKTVQQLRVELSEAEQDLKDTEYDKYISDQEDMMDQFYQDYSDKIDEKFEQLDILFQELIGIVNDNSESINATLSSIAGDVGYTMSNELANIWGETGTVISNFSGKFETYSTTIQNVLNGIKLTIDNMLRIAQNEANISVAETKSSEAASSTPSSTPSASNTVANTQAQASTAAPSSAPSHSASPSVGERITSASGRWYVDSYGSQAGTDVNKYSPDYFIVEKVASGRAYPYHIQAYKNGKKSGGSGWVKGNQIGYKTGLKESMYDHFAWTQEDGEEIIRTKDGALLTPISKGTTVFTRAMTNNLWDFAGNPEGFMKGMYKAPDIKVANGTGGNVEVNIENIALPNVTKPEEFGEQLVHAMQHNNRVVKAMQSLTVDSLAGYNSKRINRF